MKRLVIIDCYREGITPHRERALKKVLDKIPDLHWRFVRFSEVGHPDVHSEINTAHGLIITGSQYDVPVPEVQEMMSPLIHLLPNFSRPILGICFGLQLLAFSYGCEVQQMEAPRAEWEKEITIEFDKPFALIPDRQKIQVDVHHAYEVKWTPKFNELFELYASSTHCKIQATKHKKQPHYGVQFHPETEMSPETILSGEELLHGFCNLL